jgi:hypothetical protein
VRFGWFRVAYAIRLLDLDRHGDIRAITIEHASQGGGAPEFTHEQVRAPL